MKVETVEWVFARSLAVLGGTLALALVGVVPWWMVIIPLFVVTLAAATLDGEQSW